ncbi:MAG: response regulator transcription factor [Burkholderiales bacterium]|jgi:DNA-binding NarL/FixJ family response regulator|nr:response regulator transcription factor [Burkholderiales bacterium]
MTRCLVVDDHPLMRRGVRQLIEASLPDAVVDEAADGETAARLVREHDPVALVVLDLSLPGMHGLDVLERLRRTAPAARVIVLSVHADRELAVRALRAGAAGYVTKDRAVEELADAVSRVLAGGRYLQTDLAAAIAVQHGSDAADPPHARLSTREFRVMVLLAEGKTVTDAAALLHLSVKTVSTYRTRLLAKMGVASNAELARYCLTHGLIE